MSWALILGSSRKTSVRGDWRMSRQGRLNLIWAIITDSSRKTAR